MEKKEMKQVLEKLIPEMEIKDGESYKATYLGSFIVLDPCGRDHHMISPDEITDKCEIYWCSLDRAAEELGGWIEGGEGDPIDIFFCMPVDEEEELEKQVEDFFKKEGIRDLISARRNENFVCPHCGEEVGIDPYFSWYPCECCKRSLGGNREHAAGYNPVTKEIYCYEVCEDCLYYAEYGELPDN